MILSLSSEQLWNEESNTGLGNKSPMLEAFKVEKPSLLHTSGQNGNAIVKA